MRFSRRTKRAGALAPDRDVVEENAETQVPKA